MLDLAFVRRAAILGVIVLAPIVSGCAGIGAHHAAAPRADVAATMPTPPPATSPPAPTPPPATIATEQGPEDYRCLDGSFVNINYADARGAATVRVNGGPAMALRRADEAGLVAYRADGVVLYRSGPRIALLSEPSVSVRNGDTLGAIAQRVYGDRRHAHRIVQANADRIADPNLIHPGQELHLPPIQQQCRRVLSQAAMHGAMGSLERRQFSRPSHNQPDQRAVSATARDRAQR